MILELQRNAPEGKALTGKMFLYIGDETYFADTLENTEYQIPEGKYWVTVNYSPKFKRLMPVICVKGRDGIRIHYGTKPEHSKGCVLVPAHKDEQAIVRVLIEYGGAYINVKNKKN